MSSKPAGLIDRTLKFFGYEKRLNANVYSGANQNRLTLDWIATILSADQEIRGNLRMLRARGRELSRNNPIAKNFLNLLAQNVVGSKGIGYQAQVRNNDGALAKPLNDKIEAGWKEWSKKGNCTVDGKLSLREVLELACKVTATDGEIFIRKVRGFAGNKFRFALQLIDADQVDHMYTLPPSKDGNEVRLGVEVDKWGRPVAYWMNKAHPSDMGGSLERERVPAEDVIHLFDTSRIAQTRGITWFHCVMLQLRMLEGYIEAELVAARTGAAKMGWFEYTDPQAYDEPNPNQKLVMEANPGTIEKIPPGLKFVPWSPDHPGNAFPNFVITILRQVATGLGVSYNALASDLVGVNYSSMRSGLLIEREMWKRLQSWLVESFCEPIFAEWLSMALLAGAVQLDSRDAKKFEAGKWNPRGWAWVDPLKDVQAAILSIGAKLKSRGQILSEEGIDFEDVLEEISEEEKLAEELGIDLTLPAATKPMGAPESDGEGDDKASGGGAGDSKDKTDTSKSSKKSFAGAA